MYETDDAYQCPSSDVPDTFKICKDICIVDSLDLDPFIIPYKSCMLSITSLYHCRLVDLTYDAVVYKFINL